MQRTAAWFAFALCATVLFIAIAGAAQSERVVFLSTQLRPIAEAQKMRNFILKDFPREVDYVTERSGFDPVRIAKERRAGGRAIDVVGALNGELQSVADALEPLDDLAATLAGRGISEPLLKLGKLGTPASFTSRGCRRATSWWLIKRRCLICPMEQT
jgi:multiple sugar transport system substrate-binding protein